MTEQDVIKINNELHGIWDSLTITQQGVLRSVFDGFGFPIFKDFRVDFYNADGKLTEKAFSVLTDRLLASVAADIADIIATIDNYSIGGCADKTKALLADFRQKLTLLRLETTWQYHNEIPQTYWMELNQLFIMYQSLQTDLEQYRIYDFAKGSVMLCGLIDWILYNAGRAFEMINKYKDKTIKGYGEQ